MNKYIYPAIVKIIIVITFYAFIVASLSPDFMFEVLGNSNMEPFGYMYPDIPGSIHAYDRLRAVTGDKEVGIILMLSFLVFTFVFYILYRMLKSIYNHYKSTNKAIKKDV